MGNNTSRRALVAGVAAAAGAFGAAALMSATTAPTARADAFTDIINAVDAEFTAGQTEFTAAFAEFASNHVGAGMGLFFSGFDDDALGAPSTFLTGSIEALMNDPVLGGPTFSVGDPGNFATALSDAQSAITLGQSEFATALTDLGSGNLVGAISENTSGLFFADYAPAELLFMAAVDSLGL